MKLTAEQVREAIFNGSSYASYDGAKYYADGINMQAIADELNSYAEEMSYEDTLILLDELGLSEQTCRIDPIVKQVNGAEWTGFKCDTCLYWEVSPFAGLASAIGRFNYCPNCGARVIKSDQYL